MPTGRAVRLDAARESQGAEASRVLVLDLLLVDATSELAWQDRRKLSVAGSEITVVSRAGLEARWLARRQLPAAGSDGAPASRGSAAKPLSRARSDRGEADVSGFTTDR